MQSPTPPLAGATEASHWLRPHVAAVSVPRVHEDEPDTAYPESHVGWHVVPLASEQVQSPAPPFEGAADASHGFGEQVAAVSVPLLHDEVPDTVYPVAHVGWHVAPHASAFVHVPTPPFVGAADASHGLGPHVAAVSDPRVHELVPDTV